MAAEVPSGYRLREISPDDKVSGLSFGHADFLPLKIFLEKHSRRYHATNTAKSYVIVTEGNAPKLGGYVTLVCSHIQIEAPADVGEYSYEDFPAVKIARLAVDKRYQGNDLGTQLVDFSIAVTQGRVMPHVGCRFLILDSKKQSIAFYEKRGFRLLDTEHNRNQANPVMFIDVGKMQ